MRHVNHRLVERAKLVGALTRRADLAARGVTDPDVLAENEARIAELGDRRLVTQRSRSANQSK